MVFARGLVGSRRLQIRFLDKCRHFVTVPPVQRLTLPDIAVAGFRMGRKHAEGHQAAP